MRHLVSILFGAALTLAACWSFGKVLLSRWKLEVFAEELQIFRFATGAALFSLLVLALAACGLARTPVFLGAGLAAMVAGLRIREERAPLPDFSHGWKILFWIILLGFGIFYFVNALAPEVSPDGSTYHLGLVARYFRQHGLGRITTSIYANLSEGLEMLFLAAFSLGRHSAAVLVEYAFFIMLPLVMVSYARRFGFAKAGVTAAVIVFCSPVFGISGSSAYNDAAAVFVLFCLFYSLQIWDVTRQPGLLYVAGLLAGFCYGIKYTLFLALPYCLAFVGWRLYRARRPWLRPLMTICGCAMLLIAPWWIKNWATVGNPISPFGNKLFSNPYVTPRFESDYLKIQSSGIPANKRLVEHTIRGGESGGFLGPLFLLAPLALLSLRYRQGRQIMLAAGVFLLPAIANLQTRFVMLSAPFLALGLCLAVMRARGALIAFALAAPILALPSVSDGYCDSWAWRLHEFPLADALRQIPEQESLKKRLGGFETAELINAHVPKTGEVFSFFTPPEAYLARDNIVSYESAFGATLGDFLLVPINPDYEPTWLLTFHFPERDLRRFRVLQTATGKSDDEWSIAELRLYRGGREVPRTQGWRVRANANPWDVQYAFDNNPVTRWRSRQPIFNGMGIEVDLGTPERLDSVVLECSHDQYSIRLRLEAEDSPGRYTELAGAPVASDRTVTGNLRRAGIEEFAFRGITHVLMNKNDYGAADFQRNARAWGVSLVGRAGDDWLYAIK
jgi:hypothetical protein